MSLYLDDQRRHSFRKVFENQWPSKGVKEGITKSSSNCRAKADKNQCNWK